MTVYAVVDGENCGQVATNKGWSDFCEWGENGQRYRELKHLVLHGYATKVEELAEAIKLAIEESNPPEDIESVARGIEEIARANPKAELLYITDGTGGDDDEDDDDDFDDDDEESEADDS